MDVQYLIDAYRNKGVLVDTNLLLLLLVGTVERSLISRYKRTQTYLPEDYDTLVRFLDQFATRVTLPNILTEVSNLTDGIDGKLKAQYVAIFRRATETLQEYYRSSKETAASDCFAGYGLTDAAILEFSKGQYLLLTDDFRLSGYYSAHGGDVVNFNHIRIFNWPTSGSSVPATRCRVR